MVLDLLVSLRAETASWRLGEVVHGLRTNVNRRKTRWNSVRTICELDPLAKLVL